MGIKKDNLKALFSNTRTRIVILFTLGLLMIGVLIGLYKFLYGTSAGASASAEIASAPGGIQSIPGTINPTAQYAGLQEEQNLRQAKEAMSTGKSAIPTIVRVQRFGEGGAGLAGQQGQGGVGFSTLALEEQGGRQRSLWVQQLKDSNCAKSVINKVISEGADDNVLKQACTCQSLHDAGFTIARLQKICSCENLRVMGVSALAMKKAGYSAESLRVCGYNACEMHAAGFTAQELKDAGYSDGELKGAGYSQTDIDRASGIPDSSSSGKILDAGTSPAALAKLRQDGVSASALRRIDGLDATALKAAGYNASELKKAGFTAAQLKAAGFTAAELRAAGFSPADLLAAGFTPAELEQAGFSPAEVLAAQNQLPPGITDDDIKKAGCDVAQLTNERLAGVSARKIVEIAHCSAQMLKGAGYSDADLANAGFTPAQIQDAQLPDDAAIRAAGCDVAKLTALRERGVSAERIRALNGCSIDALKAAGFGPEALLQAGFTPEDLEKAGFTPAQIEVGQNSPAAIMARLRAGNCDPAVLRAAHQAGISATDVTKVSNCSFAALKAAGYTAAELKAAGFTAAQLKAAGFTAAQLKAAGFNARDLRDAGFSASELKAAGFDAASLRAAGFSANDLKAAGFNASELKAAGFSAAQLRAAGFNASELKAAGFSAKDLKDAGFDAAELKAAGFTAGELKSAGFTAEDLKNAGFTASQLQQAGYSENEIRAAGFGDEELGGLSNQNISGLTNTGTNAQGGYSPAEVNKFLLAQQAARAKELENMRERQTKMMQEQKYQQEIDKRAGQMQGAASDNIQTWSKVNAQTYVGGGEKEKTTGASAGGINVETSHTEVTNQVNVTQENSSSSSRSLIKTGDILFAVIDTSINSDEPGPILATIVSGRFKGAKLIGNFNLPGEADKMIISFNVMSVPGADKTTSISAYAIDPETARTALSGKVDHHYLMRYGSLFASSFLQGFGNAFQSANTTITVGGTGGGTNFTVQNGIGRSVLENAVISLADIGKAWGRVAQKNMNRPTTVEVYSGTPIGVLFTQDLSSL